MIRIEDLTKRYNGTLAVDHLNLEIPAGQLFAFLGPNGAGKTTTIRMLAGLLRPTQGKAFIGGLDVQASPIETKRLIGYIPDRPYLYEKLTGRDFLKLVGDLYQVPRERQHENIPRFLELFELSEAADRLIENYSHGMRQKLVLSAALLHRPRVIVIDEPMVGLDPLSARLVKDILKQQAQSGVAVFLSTHTLSVAEEIADRIGIIHKGQLLFVGSVGELRSQMSNGGGLEELFLQLTAGEEGLTHADVSWITQ